MYIREHECDESMHLPRLVVDSAGSVREVTCHVCERPVRILGDRETGIHLACWTGLQAATGTVH